MRPRNGAPVRLATYGTQSFTLSELGSLFHGNALGFGTSDVTDPYVQSPLVYACIRIRAQAVATPPFMFWQSDADDAETVTTGPLVELFKKPNPYMSWRRFAWLTQVFKDLDGACYWLLLGKRVTPAGSVQMVPVREGQVPVEMWPVRGCHVEPVQDDGSMLPRAYTIGANGATAWEAPAHAVLPMIDSNPGNWLKGVGPTQALKQEIGTLFGLADYDQKMSSRLGVPPTVFQTEAELTPEMLAQHQAALQQRFSRDNVGRPILVGDGIKALSLGHTAADMEHAALREWTRDLILAAFGVTKPLLGITDDVNRANAEAAMQVFWRGTAVYLLRDIEDDVHHRFVSNLRGPEREYACSFDTTRVPAMQENTTEVLANVKTLVDMGVSVPIAAKLVGWDVDESLLDEIAEGIEEKKAADAEAKAAQMEAMQERPELEPIEQRAPNTLARESAESVTDEVGALEKKLASKVNASLRSYALAYRARLDSYATQSHKRAPTTLATESEVLAALLSIAPDVASFQERLNTQVRPILKQMFEESASKLAASIGAQPIAATLPEAAVLISKRVRLVEGTLTTLSTEVTDALARTLVASEGFSAATLADAVQAALEDMRSEVTFKIDNLPQRASTIARTEAAQVQGSARFSEMAAQGVERHEWVASGDPATRDSHADLNGKVVAVGQSFRDDGVTLRFPGDPLAPAGETINCRCAAVPVID